MHKKVEFKCNMSINSDANDVETIQNTYNVNYSWSIVRTKKGIIEFDNKRWLHVT